MNKISLCLLCFAICINCSYAQKTKIIKKETAEKSVKNEKTLQPSIVAAGSGFKFWYMQNKDVPLIFVNIAFKNAGAAHQPADKISLPALYADSVDCGAGQYPDENALSAKKSSISMNLSAGVSFDDMYFSFSVPSLYKQDKNEAFQILIDILSAPKFAEKDVKRRRDHLALMLQPNSETGTSMRFSLVPAQIFKNHPYSHGKIGTIENIFKISQQDLQNFRTKFLTKNNVKIFISGDISQNEAAVWCEKILACLSKNEVKDEVKNVAPALSGSVSKYYAEGSQSLVAFIVKNVPPTSSQKAAAGLLFRILGQGSCMNSRLFSTLRSKLGLIYSEQVGVCDLTHANYAVGFLFVDNDKVNETIEATKNILADLRDRGITQQELDFVKTNFKGSLAVNLRQMSELTDFLFYGMTRGLPVSMLNDMLKNSDAVTLEEINRLAKDLFKDADFIVLGGKK